MALLACLGAARGREAGKERLILRERFTTKDRAYRLSEHVQPKKTLHRDGVKYALCDVVDKIVLEENRPITQPTPIEHMETYYVGAAGIHEIPRTRRIRNSDTGGFIELTLPDAPESMDIDFGDWGFPCDCAGCLDGCTCSTSAAYCEAYKAYRVTARYRGVFDRIIATETIYHVEVTLTYAAEVRPTSATAEPTPSRLTPAPSATRSPAPTPRGNDVTATPVYAAVQAPRGVEPSMVKEVTVVPVVEGVTAEPPAAEEATVEPSPAAEKRTTEPPPVIEEVAVKPNVKGETPDTGIASGMGHDAGILQRLAVIGALMGTLALSALVVMTLKKW